MILNVFRGQVIGAKVDTIASDMLLTLDLEDYNRLPPIISVGAPNGDTGLTQDDGTVIWVDPRAGQTGIANAFGNYWPAAAPTLDVVTGYLAPEVPGLPLIDQQTALTDLKSFVDSQAPRVSGTARWWLAPPLTGDGLILYWVNLLPAGFIIGNGAAGTNEERFAQQYISLFPVPSGMLNAPYEIDNDNPDFVTRIMPQRLSLSWDWAGIRGSTYVRGGTPAPEGSGYTTGLGSAPNGDAYIDAPGSITAGERNAIGIWHQNRNLIEMMNGSATMMGSLGTTTYWGWGVGQVVLVTSAAHSRFVRHEIDARPTVIQKVSGRLVTPMNSLAVAFDGVPLTLPFEWQSFSFESVLSGVGKATMVLHLLGDADTFEIGPNADAWITVDSTEPADVEWALEIGDVPAGSLAIELAKAQEKPAPPVVYRFLVTVEDPGMPDGGESLVSAQLATAAGMAHPLGEVPMEWVLIQWEDDAELVPGSVYALADVNGTTDTAGRVFTTMTRTGTPTPEYHFRVDALALPIV